MKGYYGEVLESLVQQMNFRYLLNLMFSFIYSFNNITNLKIRLKVCLSVIINNVDIPIQLENLEWSEYYQVISEKRFN